MLTRHRLPPLIAVVDADRRIRGPYAAAGQLARAVTPDLLRSAPEVAARHDIELIAVAPDLATAVPLRRATQTARMAPPNRTRFYPSSRTTRLAHGLTEFVHELPALHHAAGTIVVTNIDDADMTDLEFVAILLRRTNPQLCRVVVHSRGTATPEPMATALARYAVQVEAVPGNHLSASAPPAPETDHAAAYVASDGTSRDPAQLAAYRAEATARRALLHDARADKLEALNDPSLRLGAILYHREYGSDPRGLGAQRLLEAIEHCVLEGFYHAVIDLAPRCSAVLDWTTQAADCWLVTAKVTTALTALDRPDEADDHYDRACAATTNPSVHLQSAYGRGMLYTRFFSGTRRNHLKAKAWVNTAISMSSLLSDSERRAFNMAFNENGLALVEMHLGDLSEARRLVETGIARLKSDDGLADSQHHLVLAYNRAQLLAATGSLDEALTAYGEVIACDPHHSEYYFERASLLRKLGRYAEAMADYTTAIEQSPPYPEPHFNRADLAAELGDMPTALAELDYVLDLDPSFAAAYTRRAALRLDLCDLDGAVADADRGLLLRPDDADLHSLRGLVALEQGRSEQARTSFDKAVELQPHLVSALANRAVLRFDDGDVGGAIDDLTVALESGTDPTLLENRALAFEKAGRLAEAVADCERAAADPEADQESLTRLLRRCQASQTAMA